MKVGSAKISHSFNFVFFVFWGWGEGGGVEQKIYYIRQLLPAGQITRGFLLPTPFNMCLMHLFVLHQIGCGMLN